MLIDGTSMRQSLDEQSIILSACICMIDNPNCDMIAIQNFVKCIEYYITNCDMNCIDTSVCMMVSYVYHYVIADRLNLTQSCAIDTFITTASLKEKEKIYEASKKSETDDKDEKIWQILRHHLIPRYKTKPRVTVDSISKNKKNRMIKKF